MWDITCIYPGHGFFRYCRQMSENDLAIVISSELATCGAGGKRFATEFTWWCTTLPRFPPNQLQEDSGQHFSLRVLISFDTTCSKYRLGAGSAHHRMFIEHISTLHW